MKYKNALLKGVLCPGNSREAPISSLELFINDEVVVIRFPDYVYDRYIVEHYIRLWFNIVVLNIYLEATNQPGLHSLGRVVWGV